MKEMGTKKLNDAFAMTVERREIREQNEEINEQERAEQYWRSRLEGETRIKKPMDPHCKFTVVVPVCRERPDRLLKQIDSFKSQEDIDPTQFEIIYIVNNDIDDGGDRFKETLASNQEIIELLRRDHGLNIHVIDKSSTGKEIHGCNVGRARNRGVAEASLRFHENDRNGILIQTDADTYFEDRYYFSRLMKMTDDDPDIIGIAGGLIFEWDPDTQNPEEQEMLQKKLEFMLLERLWSFMARFIRDPEDRLMYTEDSFSGANMISRSFETAVIGGLIDTNEGEDPQFGLDLKNYAVGRGQKVIGKKKELVVVTALRESDRTASSYKKTFDRIDPDRTPMVPDLLTMDISSFRDDFKKKFKLVFNNREGLRNLMTAPDGTMVMDEAAQAELLAYTSSKQELDFSDPFYQAFAEKHFKGENADPTRHLYDLTYPPVPLTKKEAKRIVDYVEKMEGGKKYIARFEKLFQTMRIAGNQKAPI